MRLVLASTLVVGVAAHQARQSLRLSGDGKSQAIHEKKTTSLFVCNGFQSPDGERSATLKHKKSLNAKDYTESGTLLTIDNAINYGDCQFFPNLTPFKKKERVEVYFSGSNSAEVNGAFELSKTPDPNETLMLVLERVGGALSFRSFAFPTLTAEDSYAQVAVVDAHGGKIGRNAVLSLEDQVERTDRQLASLIQSDQKDEKERETLHAAPKTIAPEKVRLEEVQMNQVYAIQPGTYEAEIVEASDNGPRTHVLGREVSLESGKNYIVMRTGYDENEHLAFFPNPEAKSGGFFCGWFGWC